MQNNPYLQFDFKNIHTNTLETICFDKPLKIIETNKIEQINNCLQEIERAVNEGHYAAGFLSYEAAAAFLPVDLKTTEFPLLWFGIFKNKSSIKNNNKTPFNIGEWSPTVNKSEYYSDFKKITNAFENNSTNQVNYTIRLATTFTGNSYKYYLDLKNKQNASYNAYLDIGNHHILSISPELFFDLKSKKITVKPMKGTKERGNNLAEDKQFKRELMHSKKNQYENKLIVDLMKEELSPISEDGTIVVKDLFSVEAFPTLFQMTSTIESTVKEHINLTDIFKTLFPCGSITGAPKVETINFIKDLEKRNRDIYCGAIGFITPDFEATFNVPIRTVIIDTKKNEATYDVGGGITKMSNKEDEYQEVFTKAKVLDTKEVDFDLIETFGLISGKYIVYDEHIARLKSSATYFNFKINIPKINNDLLKIATQFKTKKMRVRLTLSKKGTHNITFTPLLQTNTPQIVTLARDSIEDSIFLYHKTTNRAMYDSLKVNDPKIFDTLFWNENNEITEFSIGNIVLEVNNELITPKASSGLLPGTYRQALISKNVIKEKTILISDLPKAKRIWLINSVREWVPVIIK